MVSNWQATVGRLAKNMLRKVGRGSTSPDGMLVGLVLGLHRVISSQIMSKVWRRRPGGL